MCPKIHCEISHNYTVYSIKFDNLNKCNFYKIIWMKYENTNEKKFKKTERQNIKYKEIYKMRRDKNVPPTI